MKTARVAIALFAIFLCTPRTQSENILGIFSYTFSTPYKVVKPYIQSLVNNGHNVTIISSISFLPNIENVRHIRVAALDRFIEHTLSYDYIEWSNSKWKESVMFSSFCYNMSHSILSDSGVQSLLQDKSEHFDMIVLEPTNSDALIGFADHFNASLVGLSTYGSSWLTDHLAGNSAPSIYRPIQPMGYSHSDSLLDRWNNWFYIAEEWMIDRLIILPGQLKLFTHFFQLPSSRFFERRTSYSLMIINQHFSLSRVRSNMPNIIEVAGLHMAEPMVKMGLARKLDINTLTEEQLMNNIKELLQNPIYALKAKEMSKRFRDQPTSPIETAIWWTEYVLRHKGAPHMRMTDQDMAFFPYYKLNIFSILFCRIAFSAILVVLICVIVGNFILKKFLRIAEEPPLFYTSI